MKGEISKGTAAIIIVIAIAALGWIGWRSFGAAASSGPATEEAAFRAAEQKAKENGVDLRNIPEWAGKYYKYHPEEKPSAAARIGNEDMPSMSLPQPPPLPAGAPPQSPAGGPPVMH